jgi:hypothetical protein
VARVALEHGARSPRSQLKTDLEFRILFSCCARLLHESTRRRFNKGHQLTTTGDQLDAKTQDPVSSRRRGSKRHHPVRPLLNWAFGGGA